MEWPDLGQPRPRTTAEPYSPLRWPQRQRLPLAACDAAFIEPSSFAVLTSRRTVRDIGAIASDALGAWLDLSCRVQQRQACGLGFDLTRRPAPSAGAIHPIHVVLATSGQAGWQRYDAVEHALWTFDAGVDAREAHAALQAVLPARDATLVLLAAEPGLTLAKYVDAASLVWRDAGALLATMSFAARALSIGFCPLGATGEPWVRGLLEEQGLAGVGAAFVGRVGLR